MIIPKRLENPSALTIAYSTGIGVTGTSVMRVELFNIIMDYYAVYRQIIYSLYFNYLKKYYSIALTRM